MIRSLSENDANMIRKRSGNDPKTIQKMIKILMRFWNPKTSQEEPVLASEREAGLVLSYLALPYLHVLPHL